MTDKNPYRTLHARMSPPGAAWDEGFAAGRAAATPPDTDLLAELVKLVEIHHNTIRPSKKHDPENQDWRGCPCLTCKRVACVESVVLAEGRAAATPDPPDAAIDSAFVAGLQKHDGGLWELAFAAGRGAERERIVAALEADYRANVADGADGIYTDGLHDAWRLTVRRAKRDDLIKPVSGSSEPRKETT